MKTLLAILALALALAVIPDADAGCCGGSSRGRLFGGRRFMRRNTVMVTYSRTTYMRAAPACESCAPAQSPPTKKK